MSGALGAEGERHARAFLEQRGLRFREANARVPGGEIDLVMEDPSQNELVFVEVRTRQGTAFGSPEESLTAQKRRALARSLSWYVARIRWNGFYRLDLVGIVVADGKAPTVTHISHIVLS